MKRTTSATWLEEYNRWQIKVQKNGVRRTFASSTPGRKGQRECHQKADRWLDENLDRTTTRLSVLYDEWIKELELLTSDEHATQYKRYGRLHIKPQIGTVRMGDLTEEHLQKVINAAYRKGLYKKTLTNIKACMTAFVKYGRKCKATTLLVENVTIPRNAKVKERTILQPDDLALLFQKSTVVMRGKEVEEHYIHAFRFEVLTGLRPGEVVGMQWRDIRNNVVALRRSINVRNKETRGKNDNARRNFSLTPLAAQIIAAQKEMLTQQAIESEFVFPTPHGDHVSQSTYYKHWTRYRDQAGLSKASPYELRHTFVSIIKQLPEGLIKPLVGHSKDMDTFGVYSHELDGDMQLTAKLMQDIFSQYIK